MKRRAAPRLKIALTLLVSVLVLILAGCTHKPSKEPPRVVDGVIDVSGWDFERDGPVKLEGDWEVIPEGTLEGEGVRTAPPSGDFVAVPWNEAHHKTRSGRDVDESRWVQLRVRIGGAPGVHDFATEFEADSAEAFHFECRARDGRDASARGGIDSVTRATTFPEGLWPRGGLLLGAGSCCVLTVPRASISRVSFVNAPLLDDAAFAGRRATNRAFPIHANLAMVVTFVIFAAIAVATWRHDQVAHMSLAFGVLSAMRIVLVNRGALFELGEGSPLDALPWWRLEYCNLWLLVAVFLRYCEAIAERKPVGRNVLATFMIAFATLAWVAPESLNRFALACGQFVTTCVGITCIWTLFQARPSRAIVLSRIGIVVGVFGAVGSMVAQNISGSFSPLLEALGSTEPLFQMAVLAVRAQEARKKSADLARATQHFVPKQFLQELGHIDVTTAKLGDAASRHVTVLFADIRNFTALSERMSPAETFAFLNACLSRIGPHIRTNGGFIDKYIGDAIMALFPRDPSDAVRASIAMQSEVAAANARHPERSALAVGIGIHVGNVMMGTIGEAERFEATVISDAVNLTARLESLTKQLGCSVLISEDVFATLDESLRTFTRRLGTFVVKGKTQPVALYEVFASDSDSLRDAKKATRDRFDAMLGAFAGDRIDESIAIASELRDACPEDGPANWWLMRLVKESACTGDDAVPSSRGIVRLDEK